VSSKKNISKSETMCWEAAECLLEGCLGRKWCTLIIFIAFNLSVVSLVGCDYIQMHFENSNSHISLGFYNREDISNSTGMLSESGSCHVYQDGDEDVFRFGRIKVGAVFAVIGVALSSPTVAYVLLVWIRLIESRKKYLRMSSVICLLTAIFLTIPITFKSSNLCNVKRYEDEEWLKNNEQYKYLNQFSFCTFGISSKCALAAIILWYTVSLLLMINGCKDEEVQNTIQQAKHFQPPPNDVEAPLESIQSMEDYVPNRREVVNNYNEFNGDALSPPVTSKDLEDLPSEVNIEDSTFNPKSPDQYVVEDSVKNHSIGDQNVAEDSVKDPSIGDQNAVEESVKNPSVNDQNSVEESVKNLYIGDQNAVEESVNDPSIGDQNAVKESVRDPFICDQNVEDSVKGPSIGDDDLSYDMHSAVEQMDDGISFGPDDEISLRSSDA